MEDVDTEEDAGGGNLGRICRSETGTGTIAPSVLALSRQLIVFVDEVDVVEITDDVFISFKLDLLNLVTISATFGPDAAAPKDGDCGTTTFVVAVVNTEVLCMGTGGTFIFGGSQ